MIPKEAIKEYKELTKKEFGVELSDEEAEQQATNFLKLFETILKKEHKRKK